MFRAGILTISDKGSRGERIDRSGQVMRELLAGIGFSVDRYEVVPDEVALISRKLAEWADSGELELILTTGGTGLGPRDATPEATLAVIQRPTPGISEAMRAGTLAKTPFAMLSRAVSGARGRCLIINLPGSPKAVKECLEVVLPVLPHAVEILTGSFTEHNIPEK